MYQMCRTHYTVVFRGKLDVFVEISPLILIGVLTPPLPQHIAHIVSHGETVHILHQPVSEAGVSRFYILWGRELQITPEDINLGFFDHLEKLIEP